MAYKYVTNKVISSNQIYHDVMVQLLTDAGWGVWDTQAAYTIMRSDGETPDGKYMYVQITNNSVSTAFWMNWNNVTHAGAGSVAVSTTTPSTSLKMFAYANRDGFMAFQTTGTSMLNPHGVVKAVPREGSFTTTMTAALTTTGDLKALSVADSSQFITGAAYGIVDIVGGKRQSFICAGVAPGVVYADNINVTLNSGSLIGVNVYPVLVLNSTTSMAVMNTHSPAQAGAVVSANTLGRCSRFQSSFGDAGGSMQYCDYLGMGGGKLAGANKRLLPLELMEVYVTAPAFHHLIGESTLAKAAPYQTTSSFGVTEALNDFDVQVVSQRDSGTSSGGNTTTTLNDTAKTWTTDQWAGKVLVTTSGLASGQVAKILSNSATQLVTAAMDIIPSTDSYLIADEGYRVFTLQQYANIFLQEGV